MSVRTALRPGEQRAAHSAAAAPASLRLAPRPAPRRPRRGPRPGTVARPRLVRALLDDSRALAAIVAPAGYGKTTLLAEWSAQDPRPFAWVALTTADDDPRRLVRDIAAALCDLQPLPAAAVGPAAGDDELGRALGALRPAVLVLDDLHRLRSAEARALVAGLAGQVPPGTTLAVASRDEPALGLGRLRAGDEVVELRAGELALTRTEATQAVRAAGLALTPGQTARLLGLTAGWPAALRLATRALAASDDAGAPLDAFGEHAIVVDYVREEILGELEEDDRAFLLRTSVLDPLTGPACDALLDRRDSADRLRTLCRANVPLFPLDATDGEFRAHPLLRRALRQELLCTDARLLSHLHRRASDWCEREGDVPRALEHAVAAGDSDRASVLVTDRTPGLVAAGRAGELEHWLARIGDAEVAARPPLALTAALVSTVRGDRDAAERWAAHAEQRAQCVDPEARAGFDAGLGVVRAAIARDGVAAMGHDAARAWKAAPEHGPWRSFARLLEGSAHGVAGRAADAQARLDEGARGAVFDAPLVRSLCLAELAFLALQSGDSEEAATLAARARTAIDRGVAGREPLAALTFAVSALVLAARGQLDAARRDLDAAAGRLDMLPDVAPWYGALSRIAMARAELRLSDAGRARRLLTDASRLVRRTPGATALQTWVDEAWAQADDYAAGPVGCPTVLTRAELRVLRLLPSHLSFREIAGRLHVSANTIKTQAHAVYRKLDASSRSQAVANARAVGLLDG